MSDAIAQGSIADKYDGFSHTTAEIEAVATLPAGANYRRIASSSPYKPPVAYGTLYTAAHVQELIAAKNGTTGSGNNNTDNNNSGNSGNNTDNSGNGNGNNTDNSGNTGGNDGNTTPTPNTDDQNGQDDQGSPSQDQNTDSTNVQPSTSKSESDSTTPEENIDSSVPTPKKFSAKAGERSATIKWKKQTSNTKGYEIQYSTDRNFKENVKKTSAKKSATSKKLKKLKSGKRYYIRMRTKYKKDGKTVYSEWSKVKKVKAK